MYHTPVLVIAFNRPNHARQMFERLQQLKPKQLFFAVDAPRPHKDGEAERCKEVQEMVNAINWECDVKTLFHKENQGCKQGVIKAIDWFFEHVEEGAILEDDCIPSQDFLKFCDELLPYYRHDKRVMQIGGTNSIATTRTGNSYYFSQYNRIWGWATWRDAWQQRDGDMKAWPAFLRNKKSYLAALFEKPLERVYWLHQWQSVADKKVDTWDYQWFFARITAGSYCIIPDVNLISNIGFGAEATHTINNDHEFSNLPTGNLEFPLKHPPFVIRDRDRDLAYYRKAIRPAVWKILLRKMLKR